MAPGVGSPSESIAETLTLPTIVFMKYGAELESPWSKREVAKERFKDNIAALLPDLAAHLVLTTVHLLQNGWASNQFFLPVPDQPHSQVLEVFQRWAGN